MATVTIEVTAGAQNMTHTRTVSTDHLNRFIAALRHELTAAPSVTDLQVLDAWAATVLLRAKQMTKQYERGEAADAVSDISFTE